MADVERTYDSGMPIAALRGIDLIDGDTQVLHSMSLDIYPGQVTFVSGPSGSGKSSCFRVLAGIEDPTLVTAGTVSLFGQEFTPQQVADHAERPLGLVSTGYQSPNLDDGMTVVQNLVSYHESLGTNGEDPYRRAARLAILFGFKDYFYRPVESLSGGEKARVALGRVLMPKPDVLLLDEPTDSLDPAATTMTFGLIRAITRREGTAIALTSHDVEPARKVADREIVISNGRKQSESGAAPLRAIRQTPALAS